MKRSELFKQAYRLEEKRGYFCFSQEGKTLWMNAPVSGMLPMLMEGQSASVVFPGLDTGSLGDICLLPLTGRYSARVSRFEESEDECFYIAEILDEGVSGEKALDYTTLLTVQMREKISRIRSLISESRSSLSDVQADYSGNVPRLAADLDRQITWINGAEKDCDALMRYVLQAEESIVPAVRDADDRMDAGRFLPLLSQDIRLFLKEAAVPLEFSFSSDADYGSWIGCSKEQFALAVLGMIRTAAVSAVLREGKQFTLQAWSDDGMLVLRLRDCGTDPAQLEAYEPLILRNGQKLPVPANLAAARCRYLMDSVGGSWMLGRTPGDTGYTMQLRFPLLDGSSSGFKCAAAYDLAADSIMPDSSGLQETIRLMFSSLEDDMR